LSLVFPSASNLGYYVPMQNRQPSLEIKGQVERITYFNEENSYTIAKMKVQGRSGLVTVVGTFFSITPGEVLKLLGYWDNHPKYGEQFRALSYEAVLPASAKGIEKYLGSGMIRGIGPVMAKRLVERFGAETLDIIEKDIGRLQEVDGIGEKRIEMVKRAWEEQKDIRDVMIFLQGQGVSPAYAVKIYKQYGKDSVAVVGENPYRLATDIFGIGFLIADRIAEKLGVPKDAPMRAEAGILYVLNELSDDGHVYYPYIPLVKECGKVLDLDEKTIPPAIDAMARAGKLVVEGLPRALLPTGKGETPGAGKPRLSLPRGLETPAVDPPGPGEYAISPIPDPRSPTSDLAEGVYSDLRIPNLPKASTPTSELRTAFGPPVYLARFHSAEVGISSRLRLLFTYPKQLRLLNVEEALQWVQNTLRITLSVNQIEAVRDSISRKIMVVTGGPGTGKTTIIDAIIRIYRKMGQKVLLAAPTGRAAKRMTETTGFEAKTIHRLLEYSPGGFKRDETNLLDADLIIIDESSMIDTILMHHFLKAVPPKATLILVGDVDQLPSVGAGNVLKDIIDSRHIPTVRLNDIFRQSQESMIIVNAHRINNGEMPHSGGNDGSLRDFYFFQIEEPEEVLKKIVYLCKESVPRRYGYHPLTDIQVLTPMHRGTVGVANLNMELQRELNPMPDGVMRAGKTLKVGDKVMQVRNNYDKDTYNGDIGRVSKIDEEVQEVRVDFDGRLVVYEYSELDEIVLAYAISVHKSQGSEYPVVIMPLLTQHYMLLQRNLLYTGVTRGKKLVILVGTRKALAIAIKNNRPQERYTLLKDRLTASFSSPS
jgi:exodeoxyribonuclease V alpha subunit